VNRADLLFDSVANRRAQLWCGYVSGKHLTERCANPHAPSRQCRAIRTRWEAGVTTPRLPHVHNDLGGAVGELHFSEPAYES
jgi:hypothetical protein